MERMGSVTAVELMQCDTLIAGSTVAAMAAALERSQYGQVLLVTGDTCLFSEMTQSGDYRRPADLVGSWERMLFPEDVLESEDRCHPDRMKLHGERLLRAHGVKLLYACQVLGQWDGAVIVAHKSGIYACVCRETFDYRGTCVPERPVFCLHASGKGIHYVNYVPVSHPGTSAEEQFRRYEAALETLPGGSIPVRGGTEVTGPSGAVIARAGGEPVPCLETGDEMPFCENPLFTDRKRVCLPSLRAKHDDWDVIVVGGGTSGASAGIFCGRLGLRTLVLEMNRQLGGTGTVGGVNAYWFGWREGATRIIDERVEAYYRKLGVQREMYCWSAEDTFSSDLKAHALLGLCLEAGVQVEFSAVVCGVRKKSNRVEGVYWAKDGKLRFSSARMVLDCTGDGDVCMFAGAKHVYGNAADGMTFWASLAQYDSPESYRNNFATMVHVGDPLDYTRFILEGRQRGEKMYDHGTYVAVRESRHIRGMETVTLEDILSMRERRDTLYSCFSNYDPKGRLTSGLVYFGLLPPNQRIDIPRGAVIPVENDGGRALEGILVGGKAISATHDALPEIRMQPDLQRQGLALAALAYQSIKQDVPASEAKDVEETIRWLGGDLMRADRPVPETLADIIARLDGSEPWEWLDEPITHWQTNPSPITRVLLAKRENALPLLQEAYRRAERPALRLTLSRLLLWHGDETGISCILDAVRAEFARTEGLPRRRASVRFGELLPDHGLMPEAVYLLNSIARAKSVSLIPAFETVLRRLEENVRDWEDLRSGIYCYCESFVLAAAGSGDPGFRPLLRRILELPELREKAPTDLLEERFGMLRISLYAALCRLGDPLGRTGLEGFLGDERRPLALAADMLLGSTGG